MGSATQPGAERRWSADQPLVVRRTRAAPSSPAAVPARPRPVRSMADDSGRPPGGPRRRDRLGRVGGRPARGASRCSPWCSGASGSRQSRGRRPVGLVGGQPLGVGRVEAGRHLETRRGGADGRHLDGRRRGGGQAGLGPAGAVGGGRIGGGVRGGAGRARRHPAPPAARDVGRAPPAGRWPARGGPRRAARAGALTGVGRPDGRFEAGAADAVGVIGMVHAVGVVAVDPGRRIGVTRQPGQRRRQVAMPWWRRCASRTRGRAASAAPAPGRPRGRRLGATHPPGAPTR